MRKLVAVCSFLVFASAALAEGKLASSWNCAKATKEHTLDVGDEPNHTFSITQATCTSTKGAIEGVREKTGADTAFAEVRGEVSNWRGRFTVTMENGDKIFYNYEGSGASDVTRAVGNKWTMDGGTGKFKGIAGSGGCTGKRSAEGTSTWDCTGVYSLGH